MKKALKMIKKGVVYGVKHPFTDKPMEMPEDATLLEVMVGGASYGASQAIIQNVVALGVVAVSLMAIGYISSKTTKVDLKVESVINNK